MGADTVVLFKIGNAHAEDPHDAVIYSLQLQVVGSVRRSLQLFRPVNPTLAAEQASRFGPSAGRRLARRPRAPSPTPYTAHVP